MPYHPQTDGFVERFNQTKLNGISAFDSYPIPRVDELVEKLGNATYLSTLDLCKGYWQVPLTPEAQEQTAFQAPTGLFHFTMPFELYLSRPNGPGVERDGGLCCRLHR